MLSKMKHSSRGGPLWSRLPCFRVISEHAISALTYPNLRFSMCSMPLLKLFWLPCDGGSLPGVNDSRQTRICDSLKTKTPKIVDSRLQFGRMKKELTGEKNALDKTIG